MSQITFIYNLCSSCELWRTMGKLCEYCKPNGKYIKTKELKVVQYLKEYLFDIDFIHNNSVGKDCTGGHLFPDIRFDLNEYQLIVEVDEFKHRGASYKCDKQRMYDIIAKLGMPCMFIRYNPDHKNSDISQLLKKTEYTELPMDAFDNYGFAVCYMYYD